MVGEISSKAARETGLPKGINVIAGEEILRLARLDAG